MRDSQIVRAVSGAAQRVPSWLRLVFVLAIIYGGGSWSGIQLPSDPNLRMELILISLVVWSAWDGRAQRASDREQCRKELEQVRSETVHVGDLAKAVLAMAEEFRSLRAAVGSDHGLPHQPSEWDRKHDAGITLDPAEKQTTEISLIAQRQADKRHDTTIRHVFAGALAFALLSGCAETRHEQTSASTRQRIDLVIPLPIPQADGAIAITPVPIQGTVITDSRSVTDGQAAYQPDLTPVVKAVVSAATAGTPWGAAATAVGTLLVTTATAYAAAKRSDANNQRSRADEHKKDADEAWDRLAGKPA